MDRKENPMDIVETHCKCGAVIRAERGLLPTALKDHIMFHILEEKRDKLFLEPIELVQAYEDAPRRRN